MRDLPLFWLLLMEFDETVVDTGLLFGDEGDPLPFTWSLMTLPLMTSGLNWCFCICCCWSFKWGISCVRDPDPNAGGQPDLDMMLLSLPVFFKSFKRLSGRGIWPRDSICNFEYCCWRSLCFLSNSWCLSSRICCRDRLMIPFCESTEARDVLEFFSSAVSRSRVSSMRALSGGGVDLGLSWFRMICWMSAAEAGMELLLMTPACLADAMTEAVKEDKIISSWAFSLILEDDRGGGTVLTETVSLE